MKVRQLAGRCQWRSSRSIASAILTAKQNCFSWSLEDCTASSKAIGSFDNLGVGFRDSARAWPSSLELRDGG